jgi:hypothetical protein
MQRRSNMAYAVLKQDIIAHEQEDEESTKMFSVGSRLDLEDWDEDGWFMFYDTEGDMMYECEERPDDVLTFESAKKNVDSSAVVENAYRPVPNMTPLSRKHLLI